jgi:hypothetical protein
MQTKIVTIDGSLAILIPPEIAEALHITERTVLDVQSQMLDGGCRLVMQPIFTPHISVVVEDRYGGAYSAGRYIAWPLHERSIPPESQGGDVEASIFWARNHLCGKGETRDAALSDLASKVAKYDLNNLHDSREENENRSAGLNLKKLIDEGRM